MKRLVLQISVVALFMAAVSVVASMPCAAMESCPHPAGQSCQSSRHATASMQRTGLSSCVLVKARSTCRMTHPTPLGVNAPTGDSHPTPLASVYEPFLPDRLPSVGTPFVLPNPLPPELTPGRSTRSLRAPPLR